MHAGRNGGASKGGAGGGLYAQKKAGKRRSGSERERGVRTSSGSLDRDEHESIISSVSTHQQRQHQQYLLRKQQYTPYNAAVKGSSGSGNEAGGPSTRPKERYQDRIDGISSDDDLGPVKSATQGRAAGRSRSTSAQRGGGPGSSTGAPQSDRGAPSNVPKSSKLPARSVAESNVSQAESSTGFLSWIGLG